METPIYTWNPDAHSTWYYLWVDDSTGTRIRQWYTAEQLGCPAGEPCSALPDIVLAPGSAKWWIQTWNPDGSGPWSDGMGFTVKAPDPAGKATLILPSGNVGTNTPTYFWNAEVGSSWYYLWVDDSTGTAIREWYTPDQAGCSGGGICYATPDIALAQGLGKWWIRTWNRRGYGPWSDAREFTVPAPVPPGKPTLVSPSGNVGTNTPNYTWNADPYSTWYYLWINDSTGTRLQKWYTAAQAGCTVGTGTCVAWPGVFLPFGPAKWWIQPWSPNGSGPWSDGMAFLVPDPVFGSMIDLGALSSSWSGATVVSADGSVVVGTSVLSPFVQHGFRWTEAGGMVDLGTLGGASSNPAAVSTNGSAVVGSSLNSAGKQRAFLWTQAGGMVNLGTLGGLQSNAAGISADGSVVVGHSTNSAGIGRAFRWTQAGGMVDLGTLGGPDSTADGVSADCSVVVGYSSNSTGQNHAFRWTQAGGMVDLGTLGGSSSFVRGLSMDGSVVVGVSANSSGNDHAFRWTQAGGMVDLGTLGGSSSSAFGVSMGGSVVVGVSLTGAGQTHAFRWTQAGGMVDLGTLGGSDSRPYGISADGSLVIGVSANNTGQNRAFRWTQAGGMVDLGTLGGSSSSAFGVSGDGSMIVGLSANSTGIDHAFRWK
jgi:probable HAF family extracellular repeat protein